VSTRCSLPFLSPAKVIPVFAVRGPNVSGEVASLSVLGCMTATSSPLAPVLLHGADGAAAAAAAEQAAAAAGPAPPAAGSRARPAEADPGTLGALPCTAAAFTLALSRGEMEAEVEEIAASFQLNEDQVRGVGADVRVTVLRPCLSHSFLRPALRVWRMCIRLCVTVHQVQVLTNLLQWFQASDDSPSERPRSPVCLVHGVFGR
jgi:hypothetical protein